MCCEIKCSTVTLSGPQTQGSVGRTDINRWRALVAELYCNYPSVSSQSWSGCAHPYPLCTCVTNEWCSPAHAELQSRKLCHFLFSSESKLLTTIRTPGFLWPHVIFGKFTLQVEKHVLNFDLGKVCWKQIQNLLDYSTLHSSTKYKHWSPLRAVCFTPLLRYPCLLFIYLFIYFKC